MPILRNDLVEKFATIKKDKLVDSFFNINAYILLGTIRVSLQKQKPKYKFANSTDELLITLLKIRRIKATFSDHLKQCIYT